MRRERPRGCRAAEQRDELAADHSGGLEVDDQLDVGRLHAVNSRRRVGHEPSSRLGGAFEVIPIGAKRP